MSCSPMPIRRPAVPYTYEPTSALDLSTTPGGRNVYGSTPGGTRIVYSREQLLSLASSPLSAQQFFQVPNEISRSPTKASSGEKPLQARRSEASPTRKPLVAANANPAPVASSHRNPFARSAPRNPGSAFDFAKGPVTPVVQTSTATAGVKQHTQHSHSAEEETFDMEM